MTRKNIKNPNPTNYDMSIASYRDKKSIVCRYDEVWLPVNNIFNLKDYYYISNYGRVYSKFSDTLISLRNNAKGYKLVSLRTNTDSIKSILVHRLLMVTFKPIENFELYDVNHIDGIKYNNHIDNLEWVTRKENIIHAYTTGLNYSCENSLNATINNDIAKEICKMLETNIYTTSEIANVFNIPTHIVYDIKRGHTWKQISSNYNINYNKIKLFTDEQVHNICKYFQSNPIGNLTINEHSKNALIYFNYLISNRTIDATRGIYKRKVYKNISKDYNF